MKLAMASCCSTRRPALVVEQPTWLEKAEAKYLAWQIEHEEDPLPHEALIILLQRSPEGRKRLKVERPDNALCSSASACAAKPHNMHSATPAR